MTPFLADENFHYAVLRGLRRFLPDVDVIRVQDVGLDGEPDPVVLEWAAQNRRMLLTHDVATMRKFLKERLAAGRSMPGVVEVPTKLGIGRVIQDLAMVAYCSVPDEWEGLLIRLPI